MRPFSAAVPILIAAAVAASAAIAQTGSLPPQPPQPIESVRRLADGADTVGLVTVAGRATVASGVLNSGFTAFHVQDATGGIGVFSRSKGAAVRAGDSVVVTGRLSGFRGRLQLSEPVYRVIPAPRRIPAPAMLSFDPRSFASHFGTLVQVEGRIVGERSMPAGEYLLLGHDGTRAALEVFVGRADRSNVSIKQREPGERVRVTGILEPFEAGSPPVVHYQLYPRSATDLRVIGVPRVWQRRGVLMVAAALVLSLIWGLVLRRSVAAKTRAISATKNWYRGILENVTDGILVLDRAGTIKYSSHSATGIHGYTSEERVGHSGFEMIHPADLPHVQAAFGELGRTPAETITMDMRIEHKEGGYRKVRTVGRNMLSDPVIGGLVVTYSDITERAAAEAERDRLFTVSPDVLCVMDMEGTFRRVNPAFQATLGYEESEVYGRGVEDFLHVEDVQLWEGQLETLRSGATVRVEARFRARDGSYRTLSWMAAPDAATDRMYVVGRDVTAEREREGQVREAQKMEAVGRLAGGIAHDFNNLLTAILSYADFLRSSTPAADPRSEDIQEIQAAAHRAADLTKQLLAFSRGSVSETALVDVNARITDMERMLRRLLGEDVEMVVRLQPGLPNVLADKGQIDQLVLNLALNARDAMPDGGALVVETAVAEVSADEWLDHGGDPVPSGSYVSMSVSDTGQGMDETTMRKMFEPFFTTKGLGRGTGLGLSTVYGILRQNQGFVRVTTTRGRGTLIEVLFPAAGEAELHQPRGAEPGAPLAQRQGATILLAEDEDGVRGALTRMLEAEGYSVIAAENGEQGAKLFEEKAEQIDLLVTDVVMPGTGGYELAASCASRNGRLPVLFLSGYAKERAAPQISQTFRSAFLDKPFTRASLIAAVHDLLSSPVDGRPRRIPGAPSLST